MVVSDAPEWRLREFQLERYRYVSEKLATFDFTNNKEARLLLEKAAYSLYLSCVAEGAQEEATLIRLKRIINEN